VRKISRKQKLVAVATTAAAVTAGVGVGYAYWTTTGTGTGSASTSDGESAAFAVSGDVPNAMYPGDSPQTITATVKNNGTANYTVQSLTAYLTIDSTHATAGCTAGDYLLNGTAASGNSASPDDLGITSKDLAPGGTQTVTYTLQFNNKTDTNQNYCEGADVTVNYAAS
jgi:hypothetical protein